MGGGFLLARAVQGLVQRKGVQASLPRVSCAVCCPFPPMPLPPPPHRVTREQGCSSLLWPTHHTPASRQLNCTPQPPPGWGLAFLTSPRGLPYASALAVKWKGALAQQSICWGSVSLGCREAAPHAREGGEVWRLQMASLPPADSRLNRADRLGRGTGRKWG